MERCDVTIGRCYLFSRGIEIRTSDSHSLIRKRDGRRLNRAAPVVVVAKSFVNKAFSESGVVLAGTPATLVKRSVTWRRARKRRLSQDEMEARGLVEPISDDEA
ncbi:hypothetical protein J2Z75_001758 [Rhizobium herbae]|uniref:Uncharacterized protein n=1 Tax=Rhizobium herbae TaxID=508661 RepID=A0ABS4EJY6_9HYPH|nr:hypothetical protein [Rhizobium herbae]